MYFIAGYKSYLPEEKPGYYCRPEDGRYQCPGNNTATCIDRSTLNYDNYNRCTKETSYSWNGNTFPYVIYKN